MSKRSLGAAFVATVCCVLVGDGAARAATALAPAPTAKVVLNAKVLKPAQGGLVATVTVDTAPGPLPDGRVVGYEMFVEIPLGQTKARCAPARPPRLTSPVAGVPQAVAIARPARGWCHGVYDVAVAPTLDPVCPGDEVRCIPDEQAPFTVRKDITVGHIEPGRCHRTGHIEGCHWPAEGREKPYWEIDQDVVDYIHKGFSDGDAERFVRVELAQRWPTTARRMRWDSDADVLIAIARTRLDIERVARLLGTLHRERRGVPYDHDD